MAQNLAAVLHHAAALQSATTQSELVTVVTSAVRDLTRYQQVWTAMFDPETPGFIRILAFQGANEALLWETCPLVPIAGDAMIAEIQTARLPVVVLDAPNDPRTNHAIVAKLGNRTIINVPVVMGDRLLGMVGLGTFGDEGTLAPTDDEISRLVVVASLYGAAFDRVRSQERDVRREQERQRLQQQLESLQRVELLGVLSAGVAHDLNNYLAIIGGNLELVRSQVSGDGCDALEDARDAVRAAGQVTRQLLSLGRRESRRHERVDLNDLVASTLSLVRRSIHADVALTHERGIPPLVSVDRVQIEQALANLLINARDAVQASGAITVSVETCSFDDDALLRQPWARRGEFARVRVHDTGPGIPATLIERIFDPLFTSKPTGTGLGLAVVSRVVAQHQGLLHCESTPGLGATFDMLLPAAALLH